MKFYYLISLIAALPTFQTYPIGNTITTVYHGAEHGVIPQLRSPFALAQDISSQAAHDSPAFVGEIARQAASPAPKPVEPELTAFPGVYIPPETRRNPYRAVRRKSPKYVPSPSNSGSDIQAGQGETIDHLAQEVTSGSTFAKSAAKRPLEQPGPLSSSKNLKVEGSPPVSPGALLEPSPSEISIKSANSGKVGNSISIDQEELHRNLVATAKNTETNNEVAQQFLEWTRSGGI